MGAARSLDQTALRPYVIKRIRHIDVKYITHIVVVAVVVDLPNFSREALPGVSST